MYNSDIQPYSSAVAISTLFLSSTSQSISLEKVHDEKVCATSGHVMTAKFQLDTPHGFVQFFPYPIARNSLRSYLFKEPYVRILYDARSLRSHLSRMF